MSYAKRVEGVARENINVRGDKLENVG